MKKFLSIALTALMLVSASAVFASAGTTTFYDFESNATITEGVDIINQPAITADQYKDYYAGAYDGNAVTNKAVLSIADGKGLDGSKALSISQTRQADRANVGVELFAPAAVSIADAQYLVVWADFTGVDFRKACFGVISSDHVLYRTDERDGVTGLKFYVQDGNGGWTEMSHGDDGCFGAAQDSSVKDYKGWMAFPISDFVSYDDKDLAFDPATQQITGVYFYFDYADETYSEKPFYFDNIGFVADYTTVGAAADESTADSVAESVAESTATSEAPVETGDSTVALALIAVVTLAGAVVVVKKCR